MIDVVITRKIHHGSKNYSVGDKVYIDDKIAKAWVALGAAKVSEKAVKNEKAVEKAVKPAPVPIGEK
jgi:hypothetical protein